MSVDSDSKVLSILENIKNKAVQISDEKSVSAKNDQETNTTLITKKGDKNSNEVRGKPKSGRFWKSKKERFLSIVKTKGIKPDFQKKTALRLELKRTKELSKQIIEQIKEKQQVRKERRRENIKRAEENKRKSEIVQVITNTAKLKRMKKKQLRFIEKRDTNTSNK
ncbi:coiled-coil domain-containing protein 86 [Melitaea cinxia]|uniref:coiled-coil domain-containing protein 86 n=1 Tax=Melitaea cinxia TaxID=113334 RepID=UPI001E27414D|nr:coiled-coil domain-containing protein 86 [Melitaea cinxia]